MGMRVKVAMMMLYWLILNMNRDEIQRAVSNPRLRRNSRSKLPDFSGFPTKENSFKRIIVIQMNVHRRYHQIMGLMLHLRQAISQSSLMVTKNIGQACHAMKSIFRSQSMAAYFFPEYVPDGFGPILIAPSPDQPIKLIR